MSDAPEVRGSRWPKLTSAVPIVRWLPAYERSNLGADLLAGCIVAALLVPQSLGYARIAGVPVEVGLYAVPLALIAYAVLGSSPQLIVGPASTVAIVSGSLVADITRGHPGDAVAVSAGLAIAAGLVMVLVGLLRVGWVAEFLSTPIVTGFVFGLTLTIVVGELPVLLGILVPRGDLLQMLEATVRNLDEIDPLTALVGGVSLLVLFVGGRFAPRVPWALIVLVLSVVVSRIFDLAGEGVATVGRVPSGVPPLSLPGIRGDDLGAVAVGGVSLALVALAEGLSATRLFAARGGYQVDTSHELVGMGAANIAAGLSSGLAVAGSLSKTAAGARAGARTQLTGLTSAGLVVVVLAAFTWVLTDLPRAVLAAIVIAAVWGLLDLRALRRYWTVRHADLVAAAVGALGVVLFGPLAGLGIAIAVSLLGIIYRSSRPRLEVLGKISDEKAAWGRVRGHPERSPVRGVVVVRLESPLFWANAAAIKEGLLAEVDRWPDTRALVLDLEASTQLEVTSVEVLGQLLTELRHRGVELYLARVLHSVLGVMERSGFVEVLGTDHIWHSISQCVRAARRHTGLKGGRAGRAGDEVEPADVEAVDVEAINGEAINGDAVNGDADEVVLDDELSP